MKYKINNYIIDCASLVDAVKVYKNVLSVKDSIKDSTGKEVLAQLKSANIPVGKEWRYGDYGNWLALIQNYSVGCAGWLTYRGRTIVQARGPVEQVKNKLIAVLTQQLPYRDSTKDAWNKFANETNTSFLKEAIAEMKRYERNWSFMTAKEKQNVHPEGLTGLRQELKFAEDRLKELEMKKDSVSDDVVGKMTMEMVRTHHGIYKIYGGTWEDFKRESDFSDWKLSHNAYEGNNEYIIMHNYKKDLWIAVKIPRKRSNDSIKDEINLGGGCVIPYDVNYMHYYNPAKKTIYIVKCCTKADIKEADRRYGRMDMPFPTKAEAINYAKQSTNYPKSDYYNWAVVCANC